MAFIAGCIIGGLIGAALVYAYTIKETNNMMARVDSLEESFNNTMRNYIQVVYMRLVKLRDSGTEGLDNLIDILGRAVFRWNGNQEE